jgi:pseudaminic acid cytidylyltransferase
MMKNLVIIPARGGSKRIPEKNIKSFLGKPIIAYSIEAAIKSRLFDEVMVSTDDYRIAQIAKKHGAKVPFMRSAKNSDDYAGLANVCIEVIKCYRKIGIKFDAVCCILPTAPFVNAEKLIYAKKLLTSKHSCIFTVTQYSYPIQRSLKIVNGFVQMKWPRNLTKRSQDLEKSYHDAGQFYFIKTKSLLIEKRFFIKKSGALVLDNLEVQDIDTDSDWRLAELKYKIINNRSQMRCL